jgi:hypothetical protein
MSVLLKEYIGLLLNEDERGGIEAQHTIAKKLKKIRPDFQFVSNVKGQQSADVTIIKNGKTVGAIESKSIEGGGGLTALFDNTVSLAGETIFDGLALSLAAESELELEGTDEVLKQFIEGIGGSAGESRPIPKDLLKNMSNPDYNGYSHKLLSKSGKDHVFQAEPGDKLRKDGLVVFRAAADGSTKAFMTVNRSGNKLITSSSPRPWASSGSIPVQGGIGKSSEVKKAAYNLMKDHFKEGGDNYFILVDGSTIYPFIVPGSADPLKLKELGVPILSPASFERAGLSTYGNAGVGKIRLALKAAFNKKFSL